MNENISWMFDTDCPISSQIPRLNVKLSRDLAPTSGKSRKRKKVNIVKNVHMMNYRDLYDRIVLQQAVLACKKKKNAIRSSHYCNLV